VKSLLSTFLVAIMIVGFALTSIMHPSTVQAAPTWTLQTVGIAANGGTISLALDTNDNPRIAYTEYTNDTYRSITTNVTYASWNGSAWDIQTLEPNSGIGSSLAVDSLNNPHICYIYSTPNSSYLKYTSWTGSNWNNQTVDTSFTSSLELSSDSLVIDSNNNLHIVYSEQSDLNTTLKYASWTGSNWSIETIDMEAPSSAFYKASVSLDSNNYPHVLYGDGSVKYGALFTNSSDVKYAEWNGQNWKIQTALSNVDAFGNIALDSNGHPHFAYLSRPSLKYASYDGSAWSTQTVDSNILTTAYFSASFFLALDSNDNPQITYWIDATTAGSKTGLIDAYRIGSAWNFEAVDNSLAVRGAGPIALDSKNIPHISYPSFYSLDNPLYYVEIKYATRTEAFKVTPNPTALTTVAIVIAVVALIIVVTILIVYFKKRKRKH
jgi:hypothetical protein